MPRRGVNFFLAFALIVGGPAFAKPQRQAALPPSPFLCRALAVDDGDTFRCAAFGKVRLRAIDAPELAGHCRRGRECVSGDAKAATAALRGLLEGGKAECRAFARDGYGRIVASCRARGVDLGCRMVTLGHAWERYGRLDRCPAAKARRWR